MFAQAANAVEQSAWKTVQETFLGAIAVLAVGAVVWLLMRLMAVQDRWVKDKDDAAERVEKSNEKDRERSDKHTEAIRELAEAVRDNTRTAEATKVAVEGLRSAVERLFDFLKFALKSSGVTPAVRSKDKEER